MGNRRYHFTGTDDEHIEFLERKLYNTQLLLHRQSIQPQHRLPLDKCMQSDSRHRSINHTSKQNHDDSTATRGFISWVPEDARFKRMPPARLPWSQEFIQNIPKSEDEWHWKRKDLGLSSKEGILFIFDCLLSGRLEKVGDTLDKERFQKADIKAAFLTLAPIVGSFVVKAGLLGKIARFMSLVFVAGCCVA
ncbi:hypothetical protein RRF57_009940 [Xylaria bambusicola]|uniref:Uncharacterized protein n=1 Tax=Xylaria bambusicola TaxID=326684 RepID=A0AAN7UXL0_9PEZI